MLFCSYLRLKEMPLLVKLKHNSILIPNWERMKTMASVCLWLNRATSMASIWKVFIMWKIIEQNIDCFFCCFFLISLNLKSISLLWITSQATNTEINMNSRKMRPELVDQLFYYGVWKVITYFIGMNEESTYQGKTKVES